MCNAVKKGLALFLLLSTVTLSACGGTKEEKVYKDVIESMEEGEAYAFVELPGNDLPILLVSSVTFADETGLEVSVWSDAYYAWDGEVKNLGIISSNSTGCPLKYDSEGIYGAGGRYVARYILNQNDRELVWAEYANEIYETDSTGEVQTIYGYYNQEIGEITVEDNSYFIDLIDEYDKATTIEFKYK